MFVFPKYIERTRRASCSSSGSSSSSIVDEMYKHTDTSAKKTISNSVIYILLTKRTLYSTLFSPSTLLCLLSYFVRMRACVRCFSFLIRLLTIYFFVNIYASSTLKSISFCHYFLSMSSLRPCLLNKVRVKCAPNVIVRVNSSCLCFVVVDVFFSYQYICT